MRFLKLALALLLVPAVGAELLALFDLGKETLVSGNWKTSPLLFLVAGWVLWLLIYRLLPGPLWVYVLGHELTHALAAYLQGAQVYAFRVSEQGGYITTDRTSPWIALAPYLIPLYTLLWTALWKILDYYYPLKGYDWVLYGGIGFTWGFHCCFTFSMLFSRQPDLRQEGYVFSWVVILGTNLLWMLLLLRIASAKGQLLGIFPFVWQHLVIAYDISGVLLKELFGWLSGRIASLFNQPKV
jgi:hypothetical protein